MILLSNLYRNFQLKSETVILNNKNATADQILSFYKDFLYPALFTKDYTELDFDWIYYISLIFTGILTDTSNPVKDLYQMVGYKPNPISLGTVFYLKGKSRAFPLSKLPLCYSTKFPSDYSHILTEPGEFPKSLNEMLPHWTTDLIPKGLLEEFCLMYVQVNLNRDKKLQGAFYHNNILYFNDVDPKDVAPLKESFNWGESYEILSRWKRSSGNSDESSKVSNKLSSLFLL